MTPPRSLPGLLPMLLAVLGACTVGSRGEREALAGEPRGATVALETATRTIHGELLEVRDSALVVLTTTQRVTLVPYRAVRRGRVELAGGFTHDSLPPTLERRERLRVVSRFPQGLDPPLLRRLLAAHDQSELEVARP